MSDEYIKPQPPEVDTKNPLPVGGYQPTPVSEPEIPPATTQGPVKGK